MSASPFEPRATLAHVARTSSGWIIDCRGPYGARHYDCATDGETAELAMVLRDQGGWTLRFSPAARMVRNHVEELIAGGAA